MFKLILFLGQTDSTELGYNRKYTACLPNQLYQKNLSTYMICFHYHHHFSLQPEIMMSSVLLQQYILGLYKFWSILYRTIPIQDSSSSRQTSRFTSVLIQTSKGIIYNIIFYLPLNSLKSHLELVSLVVSLQFNKVA